MAMQNFRTYQLALNLVREAQKVKVRAPYRDQFERSSLSVVLNLAEGSGKTSNRDRLKYYEIALGSLRETQALIDILNLANLEPIADQVGANLFNLCKNLKS